MSDAPCVIFASDGEWRLGSAALDGGAVTLGPFVDAMPDQGDGPEAVLAIPGGWCLCARLSDDTGGGDRGGRAWRRAMLFDLEEKLPVSAEELVADYVIAGNAVLAIAARVEPMRAAVQRAEAAGYYVTAICPMAVLALQALRAAGAAGDADAVLIDEGDAFSLLVLQGGVPTAWHLLPREAEEVAVRLSVLPPPGAQGWRLLAVLTDEAELRTLAQTPGVTLVNPPMPLGPADELATSAARAVVAGDEAPIANLRRDALAPRDMLRQVRRPLQAAVVAAVALLVCFSGACLLAAMRFESQRADLREQQVALYRELVPSARQMPPNIASRLASEHQAMLQRGGASPAGARAALPASSILLLRDMYARLPAQVEFQLRRIDIHGDAVELTGRVNSHGDASILAATLGDGGTLLVSAPQTTALREGGFEFTMSVRRAGEVGP